MISFKVSEQVLDQPVRKDREDKGSADIKGGFSAFFEQYLQQLDRKEPETKKGGEKQEKVKGQKGSEHEVNASKLEKKSNAGKGPPLHSNSEAFIAKRSASGRLHGGVRRNIHIDVPKKGNRSAKALRNLSIGKSGAGPKHRILPDGAKGAEQKGFWHHFETKFSGKAGLKNIVKLLKKIEYQKATRVKNGAVNSIKSGRGQPTKTPFLKATAAMEGEERQEHVAKKSLLQEFKIKMAGSKSSRQKSAPGLLDIQKTLNTRFENPQAKSSVGHEGRLVTAVYMKYDENVPKVVLKPNHQILRNADEIFNEIVKQFSLIVQKGGGEAHIALQPDFLGNLKMSLKLHNQELNTLLVVENQTVKDMILSRLNTLEQSLLHQGFSLGSFQVEVKDKNTGFQTAEKDMKKETGARSINENARTTGGSTSGVRADMMRVLPWISTIVNTTA
jgi:hypothetical protein